MPFSQWQKQNHLYTVNYIFVTLIRKLIENGVKFGFHAYHMDHTVWSRPKIK